MSIFMPPGEIDTAVFFTQESIAWADKIAVWSAKVGVWVTVLHWSSPVTKGRKDNQNATPLWEEQ